MFNSELQIIATQIAEVTEDSTNVDIGIITGLIMPIPNFPPIADGMYHWAMEREAAINFAEAILEAASKLPETPVKSDLIITGDTQAAEHLAKLDKKLRT